MVEIATTVDQVPREAIRTSTGKIIYSKQSDDIKTGHSISDNI